MKSLLVRLGVVLIGLAIFGYAEVWGADWKSYFVTKMELCFFDASSITHPSKNIIIVWVRHDFTEMGVKNYAGHQGKKYENVSHLIHLVEINCEEKKIHRLSGTVYDNKGEVISSFNSPSEWRLIAPESIGENLYKEVCK